MIITAKSRVPFIWLLLTLLPLTAALFKFQVMGTAFTFSLMKYVENPAGLAVVLSLPGMVSLVVRPVVNFYADRIWTRWGRRKPFIVVSWVGVICALVAMPLMPNFWSLLAVYMLYQFFNDLGDPMEQLKLEVVPPAQRGTSTAISAWLFNISLMTFSFVALGRFDDYQFMAGVPISGEQSLYWSAAIAMSAMLLLIMLGIRETNPYSSVQGERFSVGRFFRAVGDSNLWPVYTLIFAVAVYNSGLGVIGVLLMVEQWGFSKQDMGTNMAIGGILNVFLIMILGIFADRMNRANMFVVFSVLGLVVQVMYYCYIEFVLHDGRPSLVEVITFGEALSILGILTSLVYTPLVYDFVRRNEMGTYMAGASIIGRLTGLVTLNGIGLFMWGYAWLLLPPGGDMARVVFRDIRPKAEVAALMARQPWTDPGSGVARGAEDVSAEPWYATGSRVGEGRAYEVRLKNDESVSLMKQRDEVSAEQGAVEARRANAEQLGSTGQLAGLAIRVAELKAKAGRLEAELARRRESFSRQVVGHVGGEMLAAGEQILAGEAVNVLIFDFPLTGKPPQRAMERTLDRLRERDEAVVDMRLAYRDGGYVLAVSAERGLDRDELLGALAALGEEGLGAHLPPAGGGSGGGGGLIEEGATGAAAAIQMDLLIVEDPLDRHVSPIDRVFSSAVGLLAEMPGPRRRIIALGRTLREAGAFDHVRVTAVPGSEYAIRVVAAASMPYRPGTTEEAIDADRLATRERLGELFPRQELLAKAESLYDRVVITAAEQQITIARPILTTATVKLKYDYMAGYLWMFFLQCIGLVIIISFIRKVKSGRIVRRGLQEQQDSEAATHASDHAHVVYRPGHMPAKVVMIVFGLLLTATAMVKLGPVAVHGVTGERAEAEAVRVIKQRIGGAEQVLSTDAEIQAALEKRDRDFVFWNEFQFVTATGGRETFRLPVASQLKPHHQLRDADGLPGTVYIWYDPQHPQSPTLPLELSTWFLPGVLAVFGVATTAIGVVLLRFARRPIDMPDLAPSGTVARGATAESRDGFVRRRDDHERE